jgi:hypothetical protein
MNNETKLIVKIILLNLLFGFILFASSASKATLPEFPTAWRVGQKVHVKFTYFSEEDKAFMIAYIKKQIEPLHLDIGLVFDDNLKRPDGLTEGIEFRNTVGTTTVCDRTSTVGGLSNDNQWVVWKIIRHDITCRDTGWRSAHPIGWTNVLFHEFNHALFMDHIPNPGIIPPVLMWSTGYLHTIPELFSFADKWQLKRKYNRNQVVNFKRVNFKRRDLGKTAYLINGDKSVSFTIKNYSEQIPYLKLKNYKVVVK